MQKIIIRDLQVHGYIGVFPEEKEHGQTFLVNVDLTLKSNIAASSDQIDNTVNYAAIATDIVDYFEESRVDLLETAVSDIERELFSKYTGIAELEVGIYKVDVPLDAPYERVGVSAHRKVVTAYVGMGTNMGVLDSQLDMAVSALHESDGILYVRESERYTTKPYGPVQQDDFLNSVVEVETYLEPDELLDLLNDIEERADRKREIHWGPRTLDLDIELYDNLILSSEDLCIPHIDMANRDFVLRPLCDLNPNAFNPVTGKRAKTMLDELENRGSNN